ncbi:hypothetical protein [Streptomyces erythrochromogenes]|uniref:hypothetical protein n=1 Tax=Streptomyces erythrochromogenes TaxID=285574 RepID=UPI00225A282C|nr:hypothetical protein [Streptomyces erythrochromogenes]MCX5584219.1 hypothetical protein [Streptomyces erythrochromogenes]
MDHNVPDWFEPLTEFDVLMSQNQMPYISLWQAAFDAAEEELLATWPQGFEVEKIGRLAFERLPEGEKVKALDELFYAYWSGLMNDREALARLAAGGESRG